MSDLLARVSHLYACFLLWIPRSGAFVCLYIHVAPALTTTLHLFSTQALIQLFKNNMKQQI